MPGTVGHRPEVAPAWGGDEWADKAHSPRHVLRFLPSEGLRVGHTVHRGRQETRLSRMDSPAPHSVPDPGVGNGRSTWLRRRFICTERVEMDGPYTWGYKPDIRRSRPTPGIGNFTIAEK